MNLNTQARIRAAAAGETAPHLTPADNAAVPTASAPPVEEFYTADGIAASSSTAAEKECPRCTLVNDTDAHECAVCGHALAADDLSEQDHGYYGAAAASHAARGSSSSAGDHNGTDTEEWQCSVCTFINPSAAPVCKMCGSTQLQHHDSLQGESHRSSSDGAASEHQLPRPPDPRELSRLISDDSFTDERYSGK
jgi:ribosomal protein L40E